MNKLDKKYCPIVETSCDFQGNCGNIDKANCYSQIAIRNYKSLKKEMNQSLSLRSKDSTMELN